MPTHVSPSGATPHRNPRKRSSTAAKLVQAAALAAVLVPLGSVAMEADSIFCGFSGSSSSFGGPGCTNSGGSHSRFNFGPYFFDLEFFGLDPNANFFVTITDNEMVDFAARSAELGNYECKNLTATGGCVDFSVEFSRYPDPRAWSRYEFEIHWDKFDDPQAFTESTLRVLHSIQHPVTVDDGPDYDEDMCLVYDNCIVELDPGIRSGNTDFGLFTAAVAVPVPEPSSLILLGAGVSALAYRRRRRRQEPEAEATA